MKQITFIQLLICTLFIGCSTSQNELTTRPIKWMDPDIRPIPKPKETNQNVIWDIVDHTFFYEVGKTLDLGWTARRLGNIAGIAPYREADNVNALDETVNSSWFTNRHGLTRMSYNALMLGPGKAIPDTTGPWTIIKGKFHGVAPGFRIKDAKDDVYFFKFDAQGNHELASTAEVVSTKILHAAGYHVPINSVVYFDPSILRVGQNVAYPDGHGGTRDMTEADLQKLLDFITKEPNGKIRALASKQVEGIPVGLYNFHDVRKDDINDRVYHQHRRELRGLRVISSWINDVDRRAANTLDMYIENNKGQGHLKHYLIDMGATLGSSTVKPRTPKSGNEYFVDIRQIVPSALALGFYQKPWEAPLPMAYPELGYLESTVFSPKRWVTNYPNPAFERCTARDGYWGAKIVMAFTDADIEAVVRAGHLSNPNAEQALIRLLKERRDKIGQYWFAKINPLDRFWINQDGLHFEDLAVTGHLAQAHQTQYTYRLLNKNGKPIHQTQTTARTEVPIPFNLPNKQYYAIEIRTQRPNAAPHATRIYFYKWQDGQYQIVKVERDT
jgi:hypothetical protein